MNSTAILWRIFFYRLPLARRVQNRILQGWMIPQYRTLKSKLLKYFLKKCSTPQYRKPPCPPPCYVTTLACQWISPSQSYFRSTDSLYSNKVEYKYHQYWRDTTHFDSEVDYRTVYRNISHCQQQQSYSGQRSPGRSNSTYFRNDSWVQTFPIKLLCCHKINSKLFSCHNEMCITLSAIIVLWKKENSFQSLCWNDQSK